MLLSVFASIWNHQPFVSIQYYDSAVESVIFLLSIAMHHETLLFLILEVIFHIF